MQKNSSRCVFVGNIPYDASEEQLKEIFSEVGPVVKFRLVIDKESGKAKGYGFCEYRDSETANSAMRNLNNTEMNGRNLRVDFADNERTENNPKEDPRNNNGNGNGMGMGMNNNINIGINVAARAIETKVATTNHQTLYEVLWSLKNLISTNSEQAKQILASNPVFAVSVLRALHTLDLIDDNALTTVLGPQMIPDPNMNPMPYIPNNGPVNQGNYPPVGFQPNFNNNPNGFNAPPPMYGNNLSQGFMNNVPQPQQGFPPNGGGGGGGGINQMPMDVLIQKLEKLSQEQLLELYASTKNPLVETILRNRQFQAPPR